MVPHYVRYIWQLSQWGLSDLTHSTVIPTPVRNYGTKHQNGRELKWIPLLWNFLYFPETKQHFGISINRLYIFLIRIVSRTPFLGDDLQSSEYTCNCKRFYTRLKGWVKGVTKEKEGHLKLWCSYHLLSPCVNIWKSPRALLEWAWFVLVLSQKILYYECWQF